MIIGFPVRGNQTAQPELADGGEAEPKEMTMTDNAYAKFIQEEQRLKQIEVDSNLFTIDTYRSNPGIRHMATDAGNGWMRTMCGHKVINYHQAILTSRYYYDGTVYVNLCPTCFPPREDDHA